MSDKNQQRRPLTPPAPTVTPAPTAAPAKAAEPAKTVAPETKTEATVTEGEAETLVQELDIDMSGNWDVSIGVITTDELANMRAQALAVKRQFDDMIRAYWHLPLSRETIFAAGGMSSTFDKLIGSIERDAADYAATQSAAQG